MKKLKLMQNKQKKKTWMKHKILYHQLFFTPNISFAFDQFHNIMIIVFISYFIMLLLLFGIVTIH